MLSVFYYPIAATEEGYEDAAAASPSAVSSPSPRPFAAKSTPFRGNYDSKDGMNIVVGGTSWSKKAVLMDVYARSRRTGVPATIRDGTSGAEYLVDSILHKVTNDGNNHLSFVLARPFSATRRGASQFVLKTAVVAPPSSARQ